MTGAVDLGTARAHWIDRATLAWRVEQPVEHAYALVHDPAGAIRLADGELCRAGQPIRPHHEIRLHHEAGSLTGAQLARFPHLSGYAAFRLDPADLDRVPEVLRGQVIVTERAAAGHLLSATSVQLPGVLDDVYRAAADAPLGPSFDGGRPTLAVWAPTARDVVLELSTGPGTAPVDVAMRRADDTGVWSVTGDASWTGRYYRFRVTAWQPAEQRIATGSVTDPYSVSLSVDSAHSHLVDLDDPALAPPGWAAVRKPGLPAGRIQVQELSVRDFSIADATVPAGHRGTYLAFAEPDSAGMRHLRGLAAAGLTHVQVMPAFDFATVPDRRSDQAVPDCDLPGLPPDSERQQACIAAVADADGYNWGYDPYHYSVPEGSYATDPQGAARIVEFRRMVAGLHAAGLRVILDVVYNHTAAGRRSILDRVVPGYYHRLLDDGSVAASAAGANTASEHAMMGRLVVDSVLTWARQYKVDGFRFDLMGHHPRANILAVRSALDRLTPDADGVDGRGLVLYGEGWNFGEVAYDARFVQATQANLAGTGIGTFNDRLRDAVRGGGSGEENPRRQGFASGLYTDPNGDPVNGSADEQRARLMWYQDLIKVGLAGNLAGYRFVDSAGREVTGAQVDYNGSPAGYVASPGESVTYVDVHDNEILYDALAFKLPAATAAVNRARMQVLALSTTVLGQGIGVSAAGSDRLRSKSLDRNSYNSGDWFNQIRWDCRDGNGFGAGLPPEADNAHAWPYARPLLADPALVPDCATIALAAARYTELLRVRRSSPLFGLASADDVQRCLSFPLSGPDETPGTITMVLTGPPGRPVVVVFNARPGPVTQVVPALRGTATSLHPVLAGSADPLVRRAAFSAQTGTFIVPGRTVAVFVQA